MKKFIFLLLLIPLLISGVSFSYADKSPEFIMIYTPAEVRLDKNVDILREYGLVVYGFPWDIESYSVELNNGPQAQDSNGEWRYLGLNENLEPVTNSRFVNEMGFIGDRSKRNFIYRPWKEKLESNWGYEVNVYQWDIIREQLTEKYPGIPCGPFDDDRDYYVIQATPGEDGDTSGSLREWHWWMEGGKKQYGYETYTGIFVPPPVPQNLTVVPVSKSIKVGEWFPARAYTGYGTEHEKEVTSECDWQAISGANNVVVNNTSEKGTIRGTQKGTATVRATCNGLSDTVDVIISEITQPVTSGKHTLVIRPESLQIEPKQTGKFRAYYTDAKGIEKEVTKEADWSIEKPSVASINKGEVTGKLKGSTGVTAEYNGLTANAKLTVSGLERPVYYYKLTAVPDPIELCVGETKRFKIYMSGDLSMLEEASEVVTGDDLIYTRDKRIKGENVPGLQSGVEYHDVTKDKNIKFEGEGGYVILGLDDNGYRTIFGKLITGWGIGKGANRSYYGYNYIPEKMTYSRVAPEPLFALLKAEGEFEYLVRAPEIIEPYPVELQVSPRTMSLYPGGKDRFKAVAKFNDGSDFENDPVYIRVDVTESAVKDGANKIDWTDWSTGNNKIAEIGTNGVQGALAPGETLGVSAAIKEYQQAYATTPATAVYTHTTKAAGKKVELKDTAEVEVKDAKIIALEVLPEESTIGVGEKCRLDAWAIYDNGDRKKVTDEAQWGHRTTEGEVDWDRTDVYNTEYLRVIDGDYGVYVGLRPGVAQVEAKYKEGDMRKYVEDDAIVNVNKHALNLAIGNFAITPNPANPGSQVTISGVAYCDADKPVKTKVQFGMDGRVLSLKEITVPAKGSIPVSHTLTAPSPGKYAVEIYINPGHVIAESTYADNYMDGILNIKNPYVASTSSGHGSLTFQAVSQFSDWRAPGTARWTDNVTATLTPSEPVPPQGWLIGWRITSARLTYPKKHPEFSFSHPEIPVDTTTINMQANGHTATATFEQDWSTHGMYAIDSLTGEDLSPPRSFTITARYDVSYEYQWQQYEIVGWTTVEVGRDEDDEPIYADEPVYGWVTYNGSGSTSGTASGQLLVDGTGVNPLGF